MTSGAVAAPDLGLVDTRAFFHGPFSGNMPSELWLPLV